MPIILQSVAVCTDKSLIKVYNTDYLSLFFDRTVRMNAWDVSYLFWLAFFFIIAICKVLL